MEYVNPFELLKFTSENLSDANSTWIKRERKKLFSEIELSDSDSITYNNIQITKSDCNRAIDDLDDAEKKEFHFFIFQNKPLNDFLTKGWLGFFTSYKVESIYKLPAFLDFISPYFSEQYDKVLAENFKGQKLEKVRAIISVKPITSEEYFDNCYKSTYTHSKEIDAEINRIIKDIEKKDSPFINGKFNGLVKEIIRLVNIPMLNLLPSYFQGMRNQIASSIRSLARDINNEPYLHYEPAFKIIEIANDINTDGLTRQTITKGFYTIKGNYEDDLAKLKIRQQSEADKQQTFVKPNSTVEQTESKVQNPSDEKHITYSIFLAVFCGLMVWALFNYTVQIIILSLNALAFGSQYLYFFRTRGNFKNEKPIHRFLHILSFSICIGGFFYTPFAIFFISYQLIINAHQLSKNILYNRNERKEWSFGYFLIALLMTLSLMIKAKSDSESLKGNIETEINAPKNSTSNSKSSDNSGTVTDNSNSNPSTNNNSYVAPDPTPAPVYYYPNMANGNIPGCSKVKSKYDMSLNNRLVISVGNNADAAVKLIDNITNRCIRYVFINKNTTYSIRNIPEGRYFVKIAYGDSWGILKGKPKCMGQFSENILFKRGIGILDFNRTKTYDGYEIPSYSLKLNVVYSNQYSSDPGDQSFNSITTSSSDFYN
jgi:hypothetical protein